MKILFDTYNQETKNYLQKIKANYICEILDNQEIAQDTQAKANYITKTLKDKNGNNTNFCLWKFTKQLNEQSKPIYIYILEYIAMEKDYYKFVKIMKQGNLIITKGVGDVKF